MLWWLFEDKILAPTAEMVVWVCHDRSQGPKSMACKVAAPCNRKQEMYESLSTIGVNEWRVLGS